jgi:hypothetical protein
MRPLLVVARSLLIGTLLTATPAFAEATSTIVDRPAKMRSVVREWSARLNANDNAGASRLFALPALLTQGPYAYRLTTYRQLTLWHDGLPCAGKVTRIVVKGRFATAVFTLGSRKGHKCDAPGTEAAARFEIVGGKIRSWTQVAVPPPSGPVA